MNKTILKKIKMLILDVDGVMTDGKIVYDGQGNEYRSFNAHDGYGIKCAQENGLHIAFVSGKYSPGVKKRAQDLGVSEVYLGIENKKKILDDLKAKYKFKKEQIAAMGDDLLDYEVLCNVGVPIAVSNAVSEVKKVACYITKKTGGDGAVREVIDIILKGQK